MGGDLSHWLHDFAGSGAPGGGGDHAAARARYQQAVQYFDAIGQLRPDLKPAVVDYRNRKNSE